MMQAMMKDGAFPPDFTMPADGEVIVCIMSMRESLSLYDAFCETLDDSDMARLRKFRKQDDRHRFAAARHLLRMAVAKIYRIDCLKISFSYGSSGKPFIACPKTDLQFSITHSGDLVCVGFSHHAAIGIDIEREINGVDIEGIMKASFHINEMSMVNRLTDEKKAHCFLRIWTRKEALAKAIGCGLDERSASFDVSGSEDITLSESSSFGIETIELDDGYFISVAAQKTHRQMEIALMRIRQTGVPFALASGICEYGSR